MALVLVLFAVLASYVGPLSNFVEQWRTSRADEVKLERLKQENRRLKSRSAALSKPDVLELEARRIGMVREGERAYVVRGAGDKKH